MTVIEAKIETNEERPNAQLCLRYRYFHQIMIYIDCNRNKGSFIMSHFKICIQAL